MSEAVPARTLWPWITTILLAIVIVVLLGVIFFGWLQGFLVFRTFSYVVDSIVDASGASPLLVKGVLVVLMVPFFLALREIGKIPLFKPTRLIPKKVAWVVVLCYVSGFFLTLYFTSRDTYFRHLGKQASATKYYALTPEGIRFFDSPGFDPKYGVELKPATPELIANIEKMKRGIVPNSLVFRSLSEVQFFDTLTGAPRVWYYRKSSGEIELYSTGGFHPGYGAELKPITRDVIADLERQLAERVAAGQREKEAKEAAAKKAEAERAEAEQRAAEARARAQRQAFLERYLNTAVVNREGVTEAALLIDPDGVENVSGVEELLAEFLRKKGVQPVQGLFRPSFLREGRAQALFSGEWGAARELQLADRADSLILGLARVSYTTNPQFEGLWTANFRLELKCLQLVAHRSCGARTIDTQGAGYSKSGALENAISKSRPLLESFVNTVQF